VTDHNPRYTDACEACGHQYTNPESAIRDGADGIVAGYRCPACRHAWTCSWQIVPGRVIPMEPTAADASLFDRHLTAQVHEQAAINRAHKHLSRREPGPG
jgi:hypothetical protein